MIGDADADHGVATDISLHFVKKSVCCCGAAWWCCVCVL